MGNKIQQKATEAEEINVMEQGISPIQKQAAIMLASGETISDVATNLNINRSTIYVWLDKVTFKCYLNQLCKEIQDGIRNGIFSMYKEAIEAIGENLHSKNEMVRMRAASYIIDKIQSQSIGEVSPEKSIRAQCSTLDEIWDNDCFDKVKYQRLMKENGLVME